MGAPKQKWTQDEESALRAGVVKHGAGKWRTILKDPEFSGILYIRSNVDLKDKWRNMSVMANGWGSRDKARVALRRIQHTPKQEENATSSFDAQSDEETAEASPRPPLSNFTDMQQALQSSTSKKSIARLESLIMEAIVGLKEAGGSNKTTIGTYIEEQYWAPPDFKRLLSMKLKLLTATGKLIKVKRRYRIAPSPGILDKNPVSSSQQFEGHQMDSPEYDFENDEQIQQMRAQIELELAEIRSMNPKDASLAAARAVIEAERAMAEAEAALRDAEAAEADAEVAQAFADATFKDYKEKLALRMKNKQTVRA